MLFVLDLAVHVVEDGGRGKGGCKSSSFIEMQVRLWTFLGACECVALHCSQK